MIRSMTGYGTAAAESEALKAAVTVRSLNHRYLDVSVHLSRRLQALDDFLGAYEAEHGEITDDEMRDAARRARERAIVVRGDPEQRSPGSAQHGRGAA